MNIFIEYLTKFSVWFAARTPSVRYFIGFIFFLWFAALLASLGLYWLMMAGLLTAIVCLIALGIEHNVFKS